MNQRHERGEGMKKAINELMQQFLSDCRNGSVNCEGFRYEFVTSFENFVMWLNGNTWDMEKKP